MTCSTSAFFWARIAHAITEERFRELCNKFSGHVPPPKLTFEQYQRWVCEEIVPSLARDGKMSREQLIADFMINDGRQSEEWPDFGAR